MPRYIDADKLIAHLKDEIEGCKPPFGGRANGKSIAYGTILGLKSAISFAETLSTADVVEVVRCRDCKHWCIQDGNDINQSYFCSRDKMWCMPTRKADDFCSCGERKE